MTENSKERFLQSLKEPERTMIEDNLQKATKRLRDSDIHLTYEYDPNLCEFFIESNISSHIPRHWLQKRHWVAFLTLKETVRDTSGQLKVDQSPQTKSGIRKKCFHIIIPH